MDREDRDESFAARLDGLIRRMHAPGKPELTNEQVAAGVREHGYDISATYVWQLRNGQRDNPTYRHIKGLAAFFGVPPAYFIDDHTRNDIDREIDMLVRMREAGIERWAARSFGISDEGKEAISAMIEHVRRLEKLPDEVPVRTSSEMEDP